MRLLVDCAPLSVGGGVQVAIAFLLNLQGRPDIKWLAVLSEQVRTAVGPALAADPRIVFVRKQSLTDFAVLNRKLAAIEKAFAPDVVFTVFGPTYFRTRAPNLMGFALPHLIYDGDCPQTKRSVRDRAADQARTFLLRRADHLVVETETVRRRIAMRAGIDLTKISVIGNCVNPILLEFDPQLAAAAGPLVVLVPSAFYRHKNLSIIPRVAAELRRINSNLDFVFRLTIPSGGEPWRNIAADADRLGVATRVETVGPVALAQLALEYRSASAVMLPTLREASTAVYPEAFYMKRPLITSDLDFARELCGDAALFADPHSPAAFSEAIDRVSRDGVLRETLVQAGQQQLVRGYPRSDEKFSQQIELLQTLAAKGANAKDKPAAKRAVALPKGSAIAFHETISTGWDAKYKSGGFKKREAFFRSRILPAIHLEGRWLDAGCGSGYFSRLLAAKGASVLGIDASEGMIRSARDEAKRADCHHNLEFKVVDDLVPLALADGSIDGCLCLSVIEYLPEPLSFLDEAARVLKPGGSLVISVPNSKSLVRALQVGRLFKIVGKKGTSQYRSLSTFASTPARFEKLLARRGFKVTAIHAFDPVLPGALAPLIPASLMFFVATKLATPEKS